MLGVEAARRIVTYSSISDLASVTHCKLLKPKHTIIYPTEAQSPHVAVTVGTEKPHRFVESGVTNMSVAGLGTQSSRE